MTWKQKLIISEYGVEYRGGLKKGKPHGKGKIYFFEDKKSNKPKHSHNHHKINNKILNDSAPQFPNPPIKKRTIIFYFFFYLFCLPLALPDSLKLTQTLHFLLVNFL